MTPWTDLAVGTSGRVLWPEGGPGDDRESGLPTSSLQDGRSYSAGVTRFPGRLPCAPTVHDGGGPEGADRITISSAIRVTVDPADPQPVTRINGASARTIKAQRVEMPLPGCSVFLALTIGNDLEQSPPGVFDRNARTCGKRDALIRRPALTCRQLSL
jgi:hypothetical protein